MTGKWNTRTQQGRAGEALWLALLRKIQIAMVTEDAPMPPIMQVINDAYHLAQQRRYHSFRRYRSSRNAAEPDSKSGNA